MSYIDAKYISLVSSRLEKFKRVKSDLYNFRCPYCGDSKKYKNKARGYIYESKNDHNYKCHNCGMSRSFTNFLKDLDITLHDQYVMERYKNGITGKNSNTAEPKFNFTKPSFKKDSLDLPKISDLDKDHPARIYLESRKIPSDYLHKLYYCDKFKEWTNTQKPTFNSIENDEPRIIIPLIENGSIFGFQGRSLKKKSKVKYITVILDETKPKIYGIDSVNYEKTIYIVEGPFDSMFIENSIAMVGSDIDFNFIKSNNADFVIVYDNEKRNKQIVDKMVKCIDRKLPIIIWPDNIIEKDINEMIMSGLDVQSMLKSNTFIGLEAKAKLIGWKRV
jgi:hypothetical protein